MTGLELLDFVSKYSPGTTSFEDVKTAEAYFDETVKKGLYIAKYYKGKLVAVICYYRVPSIEAAMVYDGRTDLPDMPDKGFYVYISFVCIHPDYRSLGIMQYFANKLTNLKPAPKAHVWVTPQGEWKIQDRSINMKSNCGILAFDQIAGTLNGRSNVISLSTLARIAQDNDFLLYPVKVKRADLVDLQTPFILHSDFHFQTIHSQDDLSAISLPEEVYALAQDISRGEVVDDDEAKKVKGAKKFFKQILAPIIDPIFSPYYTGQADPFKQSLGNLLGAGSGFVTGGPVGAVLGAGATALNNAKDAEAKNAITLGNVFKDAGTGGAAGGLTGALGTGLTAAGNALGSSGLAGFGGQLTASAAASPLASVLGKFSSGGSGTAAGGGGGGALDLGTGSGAGLGSNGGALSNTGGFVQPLNSSSVGLSGGGSSLTPGIGSGFGGASIPSAATGAGSGLLSESAGAGTKGILDQFGTKGALGALSLGTGLVKNALAPTPTIPEDLNSQVNLANNATTIGGTTPQGIAAGNELTRGINAGVGGIFPQANDQYFQSALAELDRQAAIQRQNFITTQARFGRTNSGETIQQLQQMDQALAKQKSDFVLQFQEAQRQQAIGGMEQYLQLASQGDQKSMEILATALGNRAAADLAIQNYKAGRASEQGNSYQDLGKSLILDQYNSQRQV